MITPPDDTENVADTMAPDYLEGFDPSSVPPVATEEADTTVLNKDSAYWESLPVPLPAGLAELVIAADKEMIRDLVQNAHKSFGALQQDGLKAIQFSVPLLRRLLAAGKLDEAMMEGARMISLISYLLHNARLRKIEGASNNEDLRATQEVDRVHTGVKSFYGNKVTTHKP